MESDEIKKCLEPGNSYKVNSAALNPEDYETFKKKSKSKSHKDRHE